MPSSSNHESTASCALAFALPSCVALRSCFALQLSSIPPRTQSPTKPLRMVATEDVSTKKPKTARSLELCPVGSNGLTITKVTLGTMTWGHQNTEQQAHEQLDYAYERGVEGIDCAEIYPVPPSKETCGETERILGSWIKKRGGSPFREKLVIFSKLAGGSNGSRSLPWIRGTERRVDRKNIRIAVDGILQRLGTDYIDLLQIHWPDRYVPLFGAGSYDVRKEVDKSISFDEQVAAMDELIREGKIRNYGLSNETAWGVSQFDAVARQKSYARPVSIQNSYSLIYRDFEGHLAEASSPRNADVPLLAYSPLAGGALTGKYMTKPYPEDARFSQYPNYMERFRSSYAAEAVAAYKRIADEAGLTLAQLSLAWCKSRWFIRSTIIGATKIEQLKENLDAFAIDLEPSVIAEIEKVYARYRDPSRTS